MKVKKGQTPAPAPLSRETEIEQQIETAAAAVLKQKGFTDGPWVRGLWPGHAIVAVWVEADRESKLFSFPYTLADGKVALGAPTPVVETFTPIVEAVAVEAAGAAVLAEADGGEGKPLRFAVRVIRAGLSGNANYYGDAVLREAAPLFEGARVFVKSDAEHLKAAGKDVRNLIGRLSDAAFVEGQAPDTGEIRAVLTMIDRNEPIAIKVREAVAGGMADLFGLSIDATARARKATAAGRAIRVAEAFTKVTSVDLIVEPGAGGAVVSLLEAQLELEDPDMALRDRIIAKIREARPTLLDGRDVGALTDDALEQLLTEALKPAAPADAPKAGDAAPAPTADETARLVEAKVTERLNRLSAMRDRVGRSALPPRAKTQVIQLFEGLAARGETFTEGQVDTAIREELDYVRAIAGGPRVSGLGDTAIVESMEDRRAKLSTMLDAFFDPTHADHRHAQSFRECYSEITGDRRVTGRTRDCDTARLTEALGSDSFDVVLGDALNRRLIADYRSQVDLNLWRLLTGAPTPVSDFRVQTRTRFGGYGDLPVVAERDPYLELASPDDDDPVIFQVKKRGGVESISLEMVRNDDVGAIRRLPIQMSRAAKRTLAKFVLDFIRTNPVIYDGKALFHVDHGNLGTTALDNAAYAAARLAMVKQTEFGQGGERIGIGPKYLWIPAELEEGAHNIFQRSTNNDKTFVQTLMPTIVPVWYWTDANDWALSIDPMDIPTIEIAFLDGNEEPELFVQDSPTSGSLFANDSITYKIRHVYGGNVLDYRGLRKHVVA